MAFPQHWTEKQIKDFLECEHYFKHINDKQADVWNCKKCGLSLVSPKSKSMSAAKIYKDLKEKYLNEKN